MESQLEKVRKEVEKLQEGETERLEEEKEKILERIQEEVITTGLIIDSMNLELIEN